MQVFSIKKQKPLQKQASDLLKSIFEKIQILNIKKYAHMLKFTLIQSK